MNLEKMLSTPVKKMFLLQFPDLSGNFDVAAWGIVLRTKTR